MISPSLLHDTVNLIYPTIIQNFNHTIAISKPTTVLQPLKPIIIDTKEELTRSDEAEALIREKLNLACTTHLVEIL